MLVWSLQHMLMCVSSEFQHNLQFSSQRSAYSIKKFLVSLESPDTHSLLLDAVLLSHWSALNARRILLFPQPRIQRIQIRWSCRPVEWASAAYPLLIESLVWQCKEIGAAPSCMNHVCCWRRGHDPRLLVIHSPKNDSNSRVSLFGKTIGPKRFHLRCPSRHW
jgi:hypothetical protein